MYFITSISADETTRCIGYSSTLNEAREIVENNKCDFNEAGRYPWCVIENIPEGIYQYDFEPLWFEYDINTNKYIKIECRPLFIADSFVGFAIG